MLDNNHDKLLSLLQNTSVWTVASGTLGGVYKTFSHQQILLSSVNIQDSFSVTVYAFLSAAVGYGTKKGLDILFKRLKRK